MTVVQGPWSMPDAPTLSISVFARYRGVSVKTVRRWVGEGMPCELDRGGSFWFNAREADRWLEERKVA